MGPLLLKEILAELNERLTGGVISKIRQGDERDVVLEVFVRGKSERLLISTNPASERMHLLYDEASAAAPAPKRFNAFLRSRIMNARITGFTGFPGETIAEIGLIKKEGGGTLTFALVVELTGKSGNIILVDDGRVVLDALRYFPAGESERPVEPGIVLSPLPARTRTDAEDIIERIDGLTWNEAAAAHYAKAVSENKNRLRKNALRRAINAAKKRAERKLANLTGDRERAERELGYEIIGNILLSNLKSMKRGMTEVAAKDYTKYPVEEVFIQLEAKLNPMENIEKYFKRSKKARVALALLRTRIPDMETELEYIPTLLYECEDAAEAADIASLEDELIEAKYIKRSDARELRPTPEKAEPIRRFRTAEGFEILCGKSSAGNDLIVGRYGKDGDVWLHAHKVPGSHVLIKTAGRAAELTIETIETAASLAAWHSGAKNETKAEVIYTDARNVKKPKGAKPGMVTVREFKTLNVKPKDME